jgi:hypothetical protein
MIGADGKGKQEGRKAGRQPLHPLACSGADAKEWSRLPPANCCLPSPADEEKASVGRKRAVLRLLVELLLAGLYSAHSVLLHIVKQLAAAADFERDSEAAQASMSLLTALAKAGREELLGLPHTLPVALAPGSLEAGEEGQAGAAEAYAAAVQRYEGALAQRYCLPPEAQAALRGAAERSFEAACEALRSSHVALMTTEQENARVLNSRGDLPEEMAAGYEAQRKGFEGLQRTAAALAEVLDRQLPELKQAVTRIVAVADDSAPAGDQAAQQVGSCCGWQAHDLANKLFRLTDCQVCMLPLLLRRQRRRRRRGATVTPTYSRSWLPLLAAACRCLRMRRPALSMNL